MSRISYLPALGLKWPDGQTSQLPSVVDVPALSCWPAEQVVCVCEVQVPAPQGKVHAGWAASTPPPKSHLGASHFVAKHRVNPGYLNCLLSGHPFASLQPSDD